MGFFAGVLVAAAVSCFQPASNAPADTKVEVTGKITKVGLAFGQGMPSLEVKTATGRVWTVWLGSMRYLIEQNFNPKAGQDVLVRGFKAAPGMCCGMAPAPATAKDEIVAISVTLPQSKHTIRLRDESGMPLWRGRFRGGRR